MHPKVIEALVKCMTVCERLESKVDDLPAQLRGVITTQLTEASKVTRQIVAAETSKVKSHVDERTTPKTEPIQPVPSGESKREPLMYVVVGLLVTILTLIGASLCR